ncbi:MAG: DsrE family protein [Betaproteobacteria bacterium]|nr:DsrE family protein [Betaproteobacteria bacterium]
MEGGKRIIDFTREAKTAGVKFHACLPALPGYDIDPADLIPEVDQVSGGGVLADMILSSDKVLFF